MPLKLSGSLKRLCDDERGASMVEYGLLVALIALVSIGGVTIMGTKLSSFFAGAASALTT